MSDTTESLPIDPFHFVEPCEPDCSSERHAYHQGQWDMAGRINKHFGLPPHPGATLEPGEVRTVSTESLRGDLEKGLLLAITKVRITPNKLGGTHFDVPDDALDELLELITAYSKEREREARISELKQIEPSEQYVHFAKLMGYEACTVCGFNAIKFRNHIVDRIAALSNHTEQQ